MRMREVVGDMAVARLRRIRRQYSSDQSWLKEGEGGRVSVCRVQQGGEGLWWFVGGGGLWWGLKNEGLFGVGGHVSATTFTD